jgi:hypothetical protein
MDWQSLILSLLSQVLPIVIAWLFEIIVGTQGA